VLRAAAAAPVIKLRDNTWVPYIPTRPYQRIRAWGPRLVKYYSRYAEKRLPTFRLAADREVLTGPRLLLETGVFGPNEPITQWLLDDWEDNATMSTTLGINPHGWVDEEYWFSRGGLVFQANLYNPTRTYLQRGEIPAAVREMYNAFVACYYPAVNVFTEEFRQWESPSGPFFKIPDEAQFVDRLRDLLVAEIGDDLHLAAGTPRRWLADGQKISVKAAPTFYGPVSYELSGSADEVRGSVELPSRNPYHDAWITVRAPEGKRVDRVELNGSATQFDAATGKIRLPKGVKTISLVAHLSADGGTR
jgi:hypothetical protein